MASAGNPNQPAPFDVHKLFKPPASSSPNPSNPGNPPSHSPFPPPTSFPANPPSYPSPAPGPYPYPPQTAAPFHHHHHHPFLPYPQDPHVNAYQHHPRPTLPYTSPVPNPNQNPPPNSGARLMALLGTAPPSTLETAVSMPPPSSLPSASSGEFAIPPGNAPVLSTVPSAPPMLAVGVPQAAPARLSSSKQPHGRHIANRDRSVYDVDVRETLPPQLEVTPITKYSSDPGLVLGRQIAVNRSYICYGLRQGNIRVLNINTALRSLLRGHTQRVTDMAFFAEDVHLLASASVDGRIFVWKINEGPDKEDKPQITGRIVVAIQIVSDGELFHPQVCWHCHKQEILVVGIGNRLLRIDTNKVGKGEIFSDEVEPLKCPVDKLIDGVQLIGKHDGEVTDLSMSQWMMTRLASASKDGMVKIWDDRKTAPLATLRPHDGHPVNSVSFLTAPSRPDHITLVTGGPLNREIKIWSSSNEEGWLLPSDSESWHCTQTLELRSSAENRIDDAFFNQVVVLPQSSLVLLANAKKNAIYAVHIDYGPNPAFTRMDYIAEFSVTMPILSITATSDSYADGEQVVQVYCVQTQAIQQYALDLSQCLPPPLDNVGPEKELAIVSDASVVDGFATTGVSSAITVNEVSSGNVTSDTPSAVRCPIISTPADIPGVHELPTLEAENRFNAPPNLSIDGDMVPVSISQLPSNSSGDFSGRISGLKSPSKGSEHGSSLDPAIDLSVVDHSIDKSVESIPDSPAPCLDENPVRGESKTGPNDMITMPPFIMGMKATHLVTPSEILSRAVSSGEGSHVIHELKEKEAMVPEMSDKNDMDSLEVEVKVVGESGSIVPRESDSHRESHIHTVDDKSKLLSFQCMEGNVAAIKESPELGVDIFNVEEVRSIEDIAVSEASEQPFSGEEEVKDTMKDDSEKASESASVTESSTITMVTPSPLTIKGKKQKAKQPQASGPSSPSQSPYNSTDSAAVQGNDITYADASLLQTLSSFQATLNQVIAIQKDMQNQMSVALAVPVTKEGRRVEVALGRCIEKTIKSNNDALWARFQEEIAKREKTEKEKIQQMSSVISSNLNKDLPALIEKVLKKENSSLGPALARAINPAVEKVISSAIADSFQKGVGDKAVNQLEKSVNSKLEATVARQIQAQFQTTGKQALQDGLRSTMEASVVPSFELACKAMFEQIETGFQKGMAEHTAAIQQQLETAHTPLALSLRDMLHSASTITQTLSNELADGQRKLLALVAGNQKSFESMATQQNKFPLGGLHEMVEAPFDPTKELTRLISEHKFDEAFTLALQRSDVSIVSWLCSQVDLQGMCSMNPPPLSQGVLLSLLQQLSCDLAKDTSQKLSWMTQVALVINPTDPIISIHVRPIFDQVYQILTHQRALPSTTPAESNSIRLFMHVINSVLMGSK